MKVNHAYTLKSGVVLKNRLFFAPISTLGSNQNGEVSQSECDFFAKRTGAVGAIVVASAYVSMAGKAYANGLSVSNDVYLKSLEQLAKSIQKNDTKAILQIYHGGAMTHYFPQQARHFCVSQQSNLLFPDKTYTELTDDMIETILLDYEKAVKRAVMAGFDGVEIHAANSYLPNQFLMTSWNSREDKWGGSLANRLRFTQELLTRAQKVITANAKKPFALGLRLSLEDSMAETVEAKQVSLQESLLAIQLLNESDFDYIHVTSHAILQEVSFAGETFNLLKMLQVMSPTIPIIGCGNLLHGTEIEEALAETELVSACRPFVLLPDWAELILANQPIEIPPINFTGKTRQELAIPRNLWQGVKESASWYSYQI